MTKFKAVTVQTGKVVRRAESPSQLVAFKFDGYKVVEDKADAQPPGQAGGSGSKGSGSS